MKAALAPPATATPQQKQSVLPLSSSPTSPAEQADCGAECSPGTPGQPTATTPTKPIHRVLMGNPTPVATPCASRFWTRVQPATASRRAGGMPRCCSRLRAEPDFIPKAFARKLPTEPQLCRISFSFLPFPSPQPLLAAVPRESCASMAD